MTFEELAEREPWILSGLEVLEIETESKRILAESLFVLAFASGRSYANEKTQKGEVV